MKRNTLVKSCVLSALLMANVPAAHAGYASHVDIVQPFVDSNGMVWFGSAGTLPGDVCNYFGRQWSFDTTTPGGQAMFNTLMTAKATNVQINIWYIDSTVAGTDHTNGCTKTTVAQVSLIGLTY